MRVRKGIKVFVVRALRVLSAVLDEWAYQLSHLSRVIETPKVVREAESELIKASIMEELDQDIPAWYENWDDGSDDDWDEDDWYFDGREWQLKDPDNRDDR